jgi:molybdate transport system substrate-binding protein
MKTVWFVGLLTSTGAWAQTKVKVAAASSFKLTLEILEGKFNSNQSKCVWESIYGSSAVLAEQILKGAPYDLFLSADAHLGKKVLGDRSSYPSHFKELVKGRLGMFFPQGVPKGFNGNEKKGKWAKEANRIVIANPKLAPYGMRAQEVLEAWGVWEDIQFKLVQAADVSHVPMLASSSRSSLAFVSWASVPEDQRKGKLVDVPSALYRPMVQTVSLLPGSQSKECALAIYEFLGQSEAKAEFEKQGFIPL